MAQVPWTLGPVMDTAPFAKTRPIKVPPVLVKLPVGPPRRMFPWNVEVVNVLSAPTSQYTLQGWPPLAMTTWKLVPLRAASILKTQTALALPRASSVKVMVVNVSAGFAPVLQYTPGPSMKSAPGAAARKLVQLLFATSAF